MLSVNDIRSGFIEYFIENGHKQIGSSSLVPDNDPTLMFTNAGMVQFKDIFTGKKKSAFKRATTSQKCLRAGGKHNDLQNVGYTARHHTFFEMLGNFSFGDYFKEEAIEFAWKFIMERLGLSKERLLVTVHSSDEESASLWKKISGLETAKIIKISTDDNFWSMGDTGPCGPCSEIFYDHGDRIWGGPPGSPEEDGDRFVEIWNLVFMQFEALEYGSRISLPKPSVDTGMGLERIAAILQGVYSNYDIDLFKSIISEIKSLTGNDDPKYVTHNNVISDHMRAISFMIADGIIPSNEGRGYVLRRITRRALRHGYAMGMREPFLYKLAPGIEKVMGTHYTEIASSKEIIMRVLKHEEEVFMKTIDNGMFILKNELKKIGSSNVFPADVAYKLYDTYGFPFDLTQDILKTEGKEVNEAEFGKIAVKQKELSKKAWIGTGDSFVDKIWFDIFQKVGATEFIRSTNSLNSEILAIVRENQNVVTVNSSEKVFLITKKTPFYAESGGQIGDSGWIKSDNGIAEVIDTKIIEGIVLHDCVINSGNFKLGDHVFLEIDSEKRLSCSKNHTATHILQTVLKKVLGNHVAQRGSLVTNEKLRFDFIHNEAIDKNQIDTVEKNVLSIIDSMLKVNTRVMPLEMAKKSGAIALFGEKYPEEVRVVTIGDGISTELCSGEHISNTSQIGVFKIISFSSIGSGVKRIEAITGRALQNYFEEECQNSAQKIEDYNQKIKLLERELSELKTKNFLDSIRFQSEKLEDIDFKYTFVNDIDHKIFLNIIDNEKKTVGRTCLFIGNKNSKSAKTSICIFVSQSIFSKFDANDLFLHLKNSLNLKIKAGGRADFVQFGGIDDMLFESCLNLIREFIKNGK
ncbi:MAG: alanine--tRNA ligase [Holosporales bacterium]|nr:alanine--tRNA ligase [Holosporales bacterium]